MEIEDVAAGELVRWDWLCDIEALIDSHKKSGFESQEEMDAVIEETRRCGSQIAVTGTDMGVQEALDHYEPVWQFLSFIETAVRTRMGFSRLQFYRKSRERKRTLGVDPIRAICERPDRGLEAARERGRAP